MFHKCNVRNCQASSAKSFVIDDRSDVLEKTIKVTVPSLPMDSCYGKWCSSENKRNFIEISSSEFIYFSKNKSCWISQVCVSTRWCAQIVVPVKSEK